MIPSNHVVRRFQGKVPVVFYGRTCCSSRSTAALSLASHVAAKDAKLAGPETRHVGQRGPAHAAAHPVQVQPRVHNPDETRRGAGDNGRLQGTLQSRTAGRQELVAVLSQRHDCGIEARRHHCGGTGAKTKRATQYEVGIVSCWSLTVTRLVVALDNVRYPQNIGNIVRTAVGLNVDALFYLRGTADPFDWKVSCITGGLQYMLPYQTGDVKALKRFCKNHKLTPVVAHLEGKEVDDVEITQGLCVILSNESQGPDPEILKFAKR
ncbi:RNA methyltransferase, putative [Babesia caballi]|uniref:RNA methyltransferase, putative n=1 Tax=Babesia caballi TaxID=5871 RepID=A0AAV4M4Q4_BABCB|nr:RNA methyltransferase, putative [Babesia caballi]